MSRRSSTARSREAVVDHVPIGRLREEAEQAHAEEVDAVRADG